MEARDYFKMIVNEIHSVVFATTDESHYPYTCVIDMMDYDEQGLYFLTAKGKSFYQRLKDNDRIALTGLKGEDTLSSVAISLQGKVMEIGHEHLSILLDKNPYMYDIYPTIKSREVLTVFYIYQGHGEYFDLSKKPIERNYFNFGNDEYIHQVYEINDTCTHCGLCVKQCPQQCISAFKIQQNHCLHCGYCYKICPMHAIERKNDESNRTS